MSLFNQLAVGLMLSFLMVCMGCTDQQDELLQPGISKALASLRAKSVSNVNYNLIFDIPADKQKSIKAEITIDFDYEATGKPLLLDFNANPERIHSIKVNDKPVNALLQNEHIVIDETLLAEENKIQISFDAGEQSLNRNEDYLYTLFVPERASTCFPLFDQPDIKAHYVLSLVIPADWEAMANAPEESEAVSGDRKTIIYAQTKAISSYLFAFGTGKFERITKNIAGREMTMLHRESDRDKVNNNLDAIFEWHAKSLDWLEQYTGIAYPFKKFGFVLIPAFQYGGMEHPGSIFYKASSLFLEENATINQELGRARLIAHEVSHMWFGNLVTMEWFDDVWLKEVFANFFASKIVNPAYPEFDHDLKFMLSHYPSAYRVDRSMGTHPIDQHLDNLKNAGSLYGAIIYQKAPIVMRMLEDNIGSENFKTGIQEYLRTYSFQNATWEELLQIMTTNTAYDLNTWNKRWVASEGMPQIFHVYREKENQINFFSIYNRIPNNDESPVYPQRLEVLLHKDDSSYMITADVGGRIREIEGQPTVDHIYLNAGGMGYGYFYLGSKSRGYFLENINNFQPLLRASLWVNFYEMVLRGDLPPQQLMDVLLRTIPQEKDVLISDYLLDILETIYWKFYLAEERKSLAGKLEGVLLNMAINSTDERIKSAYFNTLRSITISENGIDLLKRIWSKDTQVEGLELSENDYIKLAYSLALRSENTEEILNKQEGRIANQDRKKRFQFVRKALAPKVEERNAFFESLKSPENREKEPWVLEALGYLHHPLRAEQSISYIEPSLAMLKEIKRTGDIFFPKGWLDNTLAGHHSVEAENIVRQFLYQHHDYPEDLKNKILQSADLLFRAVEIRKNKKDEQDST